MELYWVLMMIINDIQFNCELEDILDELVSQLRANNINLIQKRKNNPTHIQICCPYHANGQERRPSAGIRKEDGIFHCFACGEVHSLQEVISHCFGHYDDKVGKFGWQWLLKNFATVQVEERKDVELDFRRIGVRIGNECNDVKQYSQQYKSGKYITGNFNGYVTEEELDSYRYTHPYLYKRGMTDYVIELFDLGYDVTTKSITFPVKDISGNVLFIARRSVVNKYFHYPEGVEKPLYGLYEYYKMKPKSFDDMIVCESMFDALSFWTIGKYACALNGLGTGLQCKQLRDLPCRKIILATDMDERGLEARNRIRYNMKNSKIITEYMFPKGRKDANECTKDELRNLLEVL